MNEELKKTRIGRKFLLETVSKLFNAEQAPVLHKLKLLDLSCIAEIAQKIRLYKIRKDTLLPTLKRGMFVLLKGKMEIKPHWRNNV